MSDADSNYITEREIQAIWSFEMAKLDKEIWPRENVHVPRSIILEHFERLKHELFRIARRPRRVYSSDDNGQSGETPVHREPTDWDTTATLESERNQREYHEKVRARRGSILGLGRGEAGS